MAELSLGADVEISFPSTGLTWQLRCPAREVLECSVDSVPAIKTERPASDHEPTSQRPRILVVEDEALVAIEIAHALTGAGFEVVGPARSARVALDLLKRSGCDAAVLDINLGRENAEAIAVELRANKTPFVTLSGYSSEQHQAAFTGAPALRKPLRLEFLIAELRKCIEQTGASSLKGTTPPAQ
jgi:CheY-like chemotaxis protein